MIVIAAIGKSISWGGNEGEGGEGEWMDGSLENRIGEHLCDV